MAATQDGRVIKIHTPLGKDVLLLRNFSVQEGLSQMFQIVAEVLHEGEVGGETPHIVGPTTLLGKSVTIEVEQRDGTSRFFNGIVNRLEQRNRLERFTVFELSIVPQIWLLTQVKQSRIFQNASVQDILNTVFQQFEKSFRFEGQFPKRNYCVQYRESDFAFASRLMEEEGIYYYFEHKNGSHKVVFGNSQAGHVDCPSKSTISFGLDLPDTEDFIPIITEWITNYRLLSGKVTLWDHNFQLPHNKLEASKPSRYSIPGKDQLEVYDFPGAYGQRFDGVDRGGGSQDSELQKVFDERVRAADLAMQEIDVQYAVIKGEGVCSSMTAGHRFKFENHPVDEFNKQYVITSMTHSGSQSPDYVTNTSVPQPYSNTFTCIPLGPNSLPFRPMRTTPRPIVHGAQTATVVGPAGEEIFTDKYGRVKVQFHWDREGKNDANSSCWVRVAQSWAGKKWGTMFIPRIGMEVVVDFLEGDPDRPLIVGCVYNADTMPPYQLPEEKTKSTLKTNSSPGSGGFNELRFEDKKGKEQIFIHAEKDLDVRVKNQAKRIVGDSDHTIIGADQLEKIGGDKHLTVKGNLNEKVDGSVSLKCGGSQQAKIGQKHAVDAGMEIHLKAGVNAVIEAGASLTLKGAGGFINIGPAGVAIQGTMVLINSGGAAGSGSGASPTPPKDPTEADNAEPGQTPKAPSNPPPTSPPQFSALTAAVQSAAAKAPTPTVPQLPAVIPPLPALPSVGDLAGPVQAAVQSAMAEAASAADQLQDGVSDLKDIASDLAANAQAYADEIAQRAQEARAAAESMAQQAQQAVQQGMQQAQQLADQAQQQAQQAMSQAQQAANQVQQQAQQAAQQAQQAAQEASQQAQQAAQQAQQAAQEAGQQAQQAAQQAQQAAQEAGQQAQQAAQQAQQAAQEAGQQAQQAAQEAAQQAQQAGQAAQSALNSTPFM